MAGEPTTALMRVEVRLFASLREAAGSDRVEIELGEGATVADALLALGRVPGLAEALAATVPTMAVNRDYAERTTVLRPDDELALVPPVSGGEDVDVHVRITMDPLDVGALSRLVVRDGAGAVVTFQGVTRGVERLEYEAYVEMAQGRIEAILAECVASHGLEAAAAEHRIGNVPLGEPSVVIAVAAGHRGEAFAGAREAIDRIKAEAPVWKKEIEGGESRWVKGTIPG